MNVFVGLFDRMVLQRNKKNRSDAVILGECRKRGRLTAAVTRSDRSVPGFRARTIGTADGRSFQGKLIGLPSGGPYDIRLSIISGNRTQETILVRDVLVGDVWIAAGQSNMQGCAFLADRERPHPMVRAFRMNDEWTASGDPIHNMWQAVDRVHADLGASNVEDKVLGTGPAVSFAVEMRRLTGVPQGVLACAHGGTSMAQWDPQLADRGGASLYGATLRRVRKNGGRIAGIIWYQGESDTDHTMASVYTAKMKELVSAFRRDARDPGLPFVMVQISRVYGMVLTAWNEIQELERLLPRHIRRLAVVPAVDLELKDLIHLGGKAHRTLGRRLARAMHLLRTGQGLPEISLQKTVAIKSRQGDTMDIVAEFGSVSGKLVSNGRPHGFSVDGGDFVYHTELKGDQAVIHTSLPPFDTDGKPLRYGGGLTPYCNITDQAGRSLPAFGPVPVAVPIASTGFIRRTLVSALLPSAGKLLGLAYPRNKRPLRLVPREFPENFCSRHPELEALAPRDVLLYFTYRFRCAQRMDLSLFIGYDGPVKVWMDRKEIFFDPNGTNPALPEQKELRFKTSKGTHEVMIALGSNQGRAWGVFLHMRRHDVTRKQLKKGRGHYQMPEIL